MTIMLEPFPVSAERGQWLEIAVRGNALDHNHQGRPQVTGYFLTYLYDTTIRIQPGLALTKGMQLPASDSSTYAGIDLNIFRWEQILQHAGNKQHIVQARAPGLGA